MTTESTTASTEATPDPAESRTVPVTEAIRYRKRAQHAEQQLHDTQQELQALSTQLAEAQAGLAKLERSRTLDALLHEAEAIDLEAARALVEPQLDADDSPLVVAQLVTDLRRRKPYLFRHHAEAAFADAMAPHADPAEEQDPLHASAERALETGRRRDLLAYLRLRRTK